MQFVAQFKKVRGQLLRFDTRIYLDAYEPKANGVCVGAIVGKNPGSAVPVGLNRLLPLDLNRDKMLPTVRMRFLEGYRLAGKSFPANAFVRVWNLFYVCSKDLGEAIEIASNLDPLPQCPSEAGGAPVVWFGWGGDNRDLNPFKAQFLGRKHKNAFFFDKRAGAVVPRVPSESEFAKHTQGMLAAPVAKHLAKVL